MAIKQAKTRPQFQDGTDSTIQSKNRAQAAISDSTSANSSSLETDYELVSMILRRNHNQHRNQPFFKDLAILRKTIRKLLTRRGEIEKLQAQSYASGDAASHRKRFEKEAELRSQHEYLTEHIRDVLVPRAFVSTTGLMKDLQFAHLGVVLLGLLGSISKGKDGVGLPKKSQFHGEGKPDRGAKIGGAVVSSRQIVTGDDMGEVVERHELLEENLPEVLGQKVQGVAGDKPAANHAVSLEKHQASLDRSHEHSTTKQLSDVSTGESLRERQDKKDKGKKKKKKSNAIDDLFDGLL